MIHLPASVRVYVCLTPCDMRLSFDGLLCPPFEVSLVDGANRTPRQPKLPRHLPGRGRFARQPHGILEILAERRLARKLRNHLHFQPAARATDTVKPPPAPWSGICARADPGPHARAPPQSSNTGRRFREQISTLFPRFLRTHSFSVRALSSISCRYTGSTPAS
jgi:hypothetical protein